MNKLPVGKTIVAAYAFTLNNLGAIIGYIWIPMLIATVIGFFAQSTYIDAMITFVTTKNPSDIGPAIMWVILSVLMALLANAMMLVPVLELALGKRNDHVLAHFALGPPEWRMFGGYLALLGIFVVLLIAVGLISSAIKAAALAGAAVGTEAAAALALLVTSILFAAVMVRLAFFIPAVTLLEGKIDLGRGWMLLQGNTARLLAAIVLIALPVVVVYFGIEIALFGTKAVLLETGGQAVSAPPTIEGLREIRKHMPFTEALGFFIAPLMMGLNAGAVAYAYRAVVAPGVVNENAPQ